MNYLDRMEFSIYEEKWKKLKKIDAYVDYNLDIATKTYKIGIYPVTILFCAIALEEQLSSIYEIETLKDSSKLYKRKYKGKLIETKLDKMNLEYLINWAKNENIIEYESDSLNAIRYARNFFGHATRIMMQKTARRVENGDLDPIIPSEITIPDWFKEIQKFHEAKTGEKIDNTKAILGWLNSAETAKNAYKIIIDLLETVQEK